MSENKSEWGTQLIAAAPKRADPALDPFKQMMSYYRCAMMEVETKFRVLDVQMSLNRENNPIESIKTRLKSPESIFEKLKRRDLPMTLSAIEENLNDNAGVRVICTYPDDQEISRQLKNCAEISAMLDRLMENIRGQIEGGRAL